MKKRKMFRTNYSQQFPFLVNIGEGTRATGSSRLNSRVILMPTMLSGRLFQISTARYIKLLPEEYDLDFGPSRARLGIYSGLRRLLVLGGRVEETWFSNQTGTDWYASCTGLSQLQLAAFDKEEE